MLGGVSLIFSGLALGLVSYPTERGARLLVTLGIFSLHSFCLFLKVCILGNLSTAWAHGMKNRAPSWGSQT